MGLVDDRRDDVLRLDVVRLAGADDELDRGAAAVRRLRVAGPARLALGLRLRRLWLGHRRVLAVLDDLRLRVLLDDCDLFALLRRDQRDRASGAADAAGAADAVHVDVW